MEVDSKKMIIDAAKVAAYGAGWGLKTAATFVSRNVAAAYRAVDPDVYRHAKEIPLMGYSLFVSRREKISPGVPDGHPPLIFVHGLGGNRGNFLLMEWYLNLLGRKRAYKIHFDSDQSVEEMAEALARFIDDVKAATSENKVEVVTHSLGGIIARMVLNEYEAGKSISTMITLGAPHKGTYAARYANTPILRRIRPDSDLIRRLNEKPWPKDVKGFTFFSHNDLLVIPCEAATIEGTEPVDMTPFTHYSYLIHPRCWSAVARSLENSRQGA